jgi:predicted ester cyclase
MALAGICGGRRFDVMPDADHARQLYQRWMEMWNDDLDAAGEIFADDCVTRPAPTTTGEPPIYRGPAGMRRLVEEGRAIFDEVTFRTAGEPIVDGDRLACRWVGEGTYGGGMPGAAAAPGTPIAFHGIDVWRLEGSKVAEYWVASDGLHLMAQLGVGE